MILSSKRIINALISLRGCAGWSAPLLFASPRRQDLSRPGRFHIVLVSVVATETDDHWCIIKLFEPTCGHSFIHLDGEERDGCFALTAFLIYCDSQWAVALPHVNNCT